MAPEELQALIPAFITTQGLLNDFEQANITMGMTWAYASRQDILTEGFIKSLHKHMFDATWKWAGHYRTSDKNIGCPYRDIPVRVGELLKNTSAQIDIGTLSSDEIAVRFHHRLVSIHPFPNGNGRHSRLMADLLIVRLEGEPFSWGGNINLASPSETRIRYISALRAADALDILPLLEFSRS